MSKPEIEALVDKLIDQSYRRQSPNATRNALLDKFEELQRDRDEACSTTMIQNLNWKIAKLQHANAALQQKLDLAKQHHASAEKDYDSLARKLDAAEKEVAEFARDERLFIPGVWRCDECEFVLTRTSINATTGDFGTTSADREDSEPCPNDGQSMRRVSWKERVSELGATLEQFFDDPMQFHPYAALAERVKALENAVLRAWPIVCGATCADFTPKHSEACEELRNVRDK